MIKKFKADNFPHLIFLVVWLLSALFYFGETFLHPGIFRISSDVPILILLISAAVPEKIKYSSKIMKRIKHFYFLIMSISAIMFISFGYLSIIESMEYANYVYSTYGIYLPNLLLLSSSIGVMGVYIKINSNNEGKLKPFLQKINNMVRNKFIGVLRNIKKMTRISILLERKSENKEELTKLLMSADKKQVILSVLLAYTAIFYFRGAYTDILNEFVISSRYMNKYYDEKMSYRWGNFYDYMSFIKDNTSENAVIYHPPRVESHLWEGSQVVLRYFLHPRILVNDADLEQGMIDRNSITHVLLIGKNNVAPPELQASKGWPNIDFKAKRILIFNEDCVLDGDYHTTETRYVDKKGLIEL